VGSKLASHVGERVAYELLGALIPLLIQFRVTPGQLNSVSRVLLVRGLAREAKLRNGRVNQSQIAAATGLSRAEVRKCLTQPIEPYGNARILASSKAEQVISGWLNDKRYCVRPGRAKVLRYAGVGASFASLVREFGGDVPPRAMASELEKRGLVQLSADRIRLQAHSHSDSSQVRADIDAQISAITTLVASIGSSSKSEPGSYVRFVSIPARDAIEGSVIKRRAVDIVDGTSIALRTLQKSPLVGRERRKGASSTFMVALVLSERQTKRKR
jgi:hypothetical protein